MQTTPGNIIVGDSGRFGSINQFAINYLNALGIQNDNTLYFTSTPQQRTGAQLYQYYNLFFNQIKDIIPLIKCMYRFRWGNYAQNKFNLLNPIDSNAAFRLIQTGTLNYLNTGTVGDGSTGFFNTKFISDNNGLSVNNNHIVLCSRTEQVAPVTTQFYETGSSNVAGSILSAMFIRRSTGFAGYDSGNFTLNRNTVSIPSGLGIFIGTVNNDLFSRFYRNGSLISTRTITNQASLSNLEDYIFCVNESNIARYHSQKELNFYSKGFGLTQQQTTIYNNAINQLNINEGI